MKLSKLVIILIISVAILFIAVGFLSFDVINKMEIIKSYENLPYEMQGQP